MSAKVLNIEYYNSKREPCSIDLLTTLHNEYAAENVYIEDLENVESDDSFLTPPAKPKPINEADELKKSLLKFPFLLNIIQKEMNRIMKGEIQLNDILVESTSHKSEETTVDDAFEHLQKLLILKAEYDDCAQVLGTSNIKTQCCLSNLEKCFLSFKLAPHFISTLLEIAQIKTNDITKYNQLVTEVNGIKNEVSTEQKELHKIEEQVQGIIDHWQHLGGFAPWKPSISRKKGRALYQSKVSLRTSFYS